MNKINILFLFGILLTFFSCAEGGLIYDLDQLGESKQTQAEIISEVGDLNTYNIRMLSQGELETFLENNETTLIKHT